MSIRKINYLSNCGLINKLKINNFKKIPILNKIVLNISLEKMSKFNSAGISTEMTTLIQTKIFLLLYQMESKLPYISVKFNSKSDTLDKLYNVKIIFSNKEQISCFLKTFFLEYWKKPKSNNLSKLSNKTNVEIKIKHLKKTEIITRKIYLSDLYELRNLVDETLPKNLVLTARFYVTYENIKSKKLTNFPPF